MRNFNRKLPLLMAGGILLSGLLSQSCSQNEKKGGADTKVADTLVADTIENTSEEFHADNDIAMFVSSIMDALANDEPLVADDYNFSGVLTDGAGTPLYVDVLGSPGYWTVKVESAKSAIISNEYLGDLVPVDVVNYLLTTLDIPSEPVLEAEEEKKGREETVVTYRKGDVLMYANEQRTKTPNGSEGLLLKLILKRAPQIPGDTSGDKKSQKKK